MGTDRPVFCHQASLGGLPLPGTWVPGITSFLQLMTESFDVKCVILHGSYATGKWIPGSDVDLVVIADGLPRRFLDRLRALSDLAPRGVPVEVLAYTPEEFSGMLEDMHVTALDATSRGIPLVGPEFFAVLRARLDEMIARGLRRGKTSWYWETKGRGVCE